MNVSTWQIKQTNDLYNLELPPIKQLNVWFDRVIRWLDLVKSVSREI